MIIVRAVLLASLATYVAGSARAQTGAPVSCPAPDLLGAIPGPDLYCIELLPGAGVEEASGAVYLRPPASPFGVAVTPAGSHLHDLAFELNGLPDPASLGPYTTYIAWATTPQLAPTVKLGEVSNGRTAAGRVEFDRFLILITAEASGDVVERRGPAALRGTSASVRMQPHDIAYQLAGMLERAGQPGDHALHVAVDSIGWTPPPMHPTVSMPSELMMLRPAVSPYRPPSSGDPPFATGARLLRVRDGDAIDLVAAPVRRLLFGRSVTLIGFNGQLPGPLIQVEEASTIRIRFTNGTDLPTAIHWHGIRLDNRFDGVPHVTQEPVEPRASFEYVVRFPDAGLYWYHPHHREDILQDLGLYGNLLVRSGEPEYFAPANREEFLILDDLLMADDRIVEHGLEAPTHALMGRFGNVLLVNGEPRWTAEAASGEVVRLFLTNVASTRVLNLSFGEGARMKVVASDLGRFEREEWVESVVIAPAERYVVDVRFEGRGDVPLVNRVRPIDPIRAAFFEEVDTIGVVRVRAESAVPDHGEAFARLRANASVTAEVEGYRAWLDRLPDHHLLITLDVGSALPFPLLPLMRFESVYRHPVEWSGTMPEMDWVATGRDVRWVLRDPVTGRENMDIDWRFRLGDVVKIRLINDRAALHAMQHPIHIHGQRFLVLSVNGVPEDNLVWKDTVLLPTGFVADVLLEITNPGTWMLHCHIAEHIETGMKMVFTVS